MIQPKPNSGETGFLNLPVCCNKADGIRGANYGVNGRE
jgi:hypothetical protein